MMISYLEINRLRYAIDTKNIQHLYISENILMDLHHIWPLMIQPNQRYFGIICEAIAMQSHSNVSNYTLLSLIRWHR